ncbi:MAG: response regulator transcription factor [Chloroflexi bacterium]|nr:response regulator transcription factor [Chloroflexota bacterium]
MIRVAIVSPNHALRVGLREMLSHHPGIQVVGEVARLADVNEKETEVAVLASVSSARLRDDKGNFALLFLTDDLDSVRAPLSSSPRAWGVFACRCRRG